MEVHAMPIMPKLNRLLIIWLLIGLAPGALLPFAGAQDQRRENERLRMENDDLQRELEAARTRIADLEAEIRTLREAWAKQGGSSGGGTDRVKPEPAPGPKITIDETRPEASARALRIALAESHADAMGELTPGEPRSAERQAWLKATRQWLPATQRKLRQSIDWVVRIEDGTPIRNGIVLRLMQLDPVTEAEIGDAFEIRLQHGVAARFRAQWERTESTRWRLQGRATPDLMINPERVTTGAFDRPRLVAPCLEFAFVVDASSMVPLP